MDLNNTDYLLNELSKNDLHIIHRIYLGQNIRSEGILQDEVFADEDSLITLLSMGLIKVNHWYLDQFLTTEIGSAVGHRLVEETIISQGEKAVAQIKREIPSGIISFIIRRFFENLAFTAEKNESKYSLSWEDYILSNTKVWILWDKFFEILQSHNLCVKTLYYVSTRGGETRDYNFVICPEIQRWLTNEITNPDFTIEQEKNLRIFIFLKDVKKILGLDDFDQVRHRYYEVLKAQEICESDIEPVINELNSLKITSEYRGLLSDQRPFDILNPLSYSIFLDQQLLSPAANFLITGEDAMRLFKERKKDYPSLKEAKLISGIMDNDDIGRFYISISSFERQIREFIKEFLGSGWEKRIKNDIPSVYQNWLKTSEKDKGWGIDPEKELISYADLGDYITIIKKYSRMFTANDDELGNIATHLRIWYNQGRNPIMHCRTITSQKFYTAQSAIEYLEEWMRRRRNLRSI